MNVVDWKLHSMECLYYKFKITKYISFSKVIQYTYQSNYYLFVNIFTLLYFFVAKFIVHSL